MLKNIKASFFLKVLFFHISEGQKLKVARHSKYLQKILDRRLIHYKIFSERFIVYDQDGKGKVYNYSDRLLFEGEYLNGERNGKGKEYNYFNGKLEFEGEYYKGLRNGKGKEYGYYYGELQFEGEYLNGERNGKGKEYNGKSLFEGEYLNGERNGKGKEYYKGQLFFEGEYLNDKRNGKGKEYNVRTGKLEFEGEYYEDQRISFISNNKTDNLTQFNKKEDKYSNESINGKIKAYDIYTGELIFEGEYLNGK